MTTKSITQWTFRGAVVATAIGLAGCSNPYSPGQRALGGGAIGAGAGSLVGAAAGSPAAGALIGGALGAGAGALTTPQRPRYGNGYDNGYNRGYDNGYHGGYNNGYYNNPPPRY